MFALNMGTATTYYTLFVYAATWVAEKTPVGRAAALDITTSSILTFLVVLPIAAWVSDRVGRKPVMLCGMVGCALLAVPLATAMHGTSALTIAAAQMAFSALLAMSMAADSSRDVRDVSARSAGERGERRLQPRVRAVRRHGAGGRGLADCEEGNDVAFAWYIAAVTVVSIVVALGTRDRSRAAASLVTIAAHNTIRSWPTITSPAKPAARTPSVKFVTA